MGTIDRHRQQAELCLQLARLTSLRHEAEMLRTRAQEHLHEAERLLEREARTHPPGQRTA